MSSRTPSPASVPLRTLSVFATGTLLIVSCRTSAVADEALSFVRDVRPILAENCLACHGADEGSRQAELRLDIPADLSKAASPAARAIVPGHPEQSELMLRVLASDPDLRMPPPDSGHSLSPEQIQTLRSWIALGARYEMHWAFMRPQLPEIPVDPADSWSRGPIDRLVWKTLRQKQLSPQPDTDPMTLIRRLTLDLTGLPPTVAEADAFAADPSDDHYAIIVDRLLRSPRFGEHWARMWLDLARYADTKGYEKDQPREIWRYRDWVINALNADLPFDQFTIEQLAGDLLPDATTEQILATAFHRNTMTNDEGGTDDEEFRLAAVKDRVDTTVQVWMGLTMGCAKCHSHKYDPISHQEYYQFLACFNQTEDADRPDDAPRIPTATSEQQQQQLKLEQQIAALRQQYEQISPEFTAARHAWERQLAANPGWRTAVPLSATSANGSTLKIQPDRSVLARGEIPASDVYTLILSVEELVSVHGAVPLTAIRLEALTHRSLPRQGPGRSRSDPNFVLNELTLKLLNPDGLPARDIPLHQARADFSQNGWEVEKAIDGNPDTGWAISPQQGQPHVAVFALTEPLMLQKGQKLQLDLSQQYAANSLLMGCIRISCTSQPADTLKAELQSTIELAAIPPDQRTPEQDLHLLEEYRRIDPSTAPLWTQLKETQTRLDELQKSIPRTPIMKELPADRQRVTRIHIRGNFLDPGEVVTPALPVAFSLPNTDTAETGTVQEKDVTAFEGNRLDVARWLMAPENPLTSRVMVNRIWARLFGRGLVETEEDFGMQGALPDHPELLDWLAVEFQETQQWSLKQLCRSLVMSSTYRQNSAVTDAEREADPENRWLSRGARFRLTAEAVRDQALFAAALLSEKIGGPSVMPPQPDGIWRTTYSSLRWTTPADEDRYRRGLYTFLRRTSPYPSMITFDAGSGEVCLIRRIPTNTPLQALVTMNDPVFIEAAGALARISNTENKGDSVVLQAMFRRVLLRPATEEELDRMLKLLKETTHEFRSAPTDATDVVTSANLQSLVDAADHPKMAALTIVASVLLNLDETLTRP